MSLAHNEELSLIRMQTPLLSRVRHGFFGRTGGVSSGDYASLNVGLGSGDERGAVAQNRARVLAALAPDCTLVTLHQVHSATCVVAHAWSEAARAQADALVTDQPGLALGVLTADCAPILLADVQAGVIGAAHAGWKGALSGVVAATVDAMVGLGARVADIHAAIGPCIAQRSYEVDAAFEQRFTMQDADYERFFKPARRAGHAHFDLEGFVGHQLAQSGVRHVALMGEDTYANPARFFSYRRMCHEGGADYGRQISLIALG
jgi:polyphenol oxidase